MPVIVALLKTSSPSCEKKRRAKSPKRAAGKKKQPKRSEDDVDDDDLEDPPEETEDDGTGDTDPPPQHLTCSATDAPPRLALLVPDELSRALAQHRDPALHQLGAMVGSLASELAVTRQSNEELQARITCQAEEARLPQEVRDF